MSLLRDSFGAINDRFHLAGSYALVAVLLRVTSALADRDDTWVPVAALVFVLYHAAGCGILGLVYQAAVRRDHTVSFGRYAVALFAPILWLSIKVLLLVYGLAALGAGAFSLARGSDLPGDLIDTEAFYWSAPVLGLVAQTLLLYSLPICIAARERGVRGPHVRMGLMVLKAHRAESARLIGVLVLIAGLGAGQQIIRGFEGRNAPPDIPEALILFASSYLELVALYGAACVALLRGGPDRPGGRPEEIDARASGPPA